MLIIAGPCVIETEKHTLDIATKLFKILCGLNLELIFKASFDKANRTSITSYRGVGIDVGLKILDKVKKELGIKVTTDIHESYQAPIVANVVDIIQIPAFLCRQTDLLLAAGKTGKFVNVKKGQFCSPFDMKYVVEKLQTVTSSDKISIIERGTSFGYNTLINDFAAFPYLRSVAPLIFDATHSVQTPGSCGGSTGGNRNNVALLARAAVAVGVDGLFFEVHDDPDNAPSDGLNMIKLSKFREILQEVMQYQQT